jgi:hypothetical protein
MSGSDSDGDTPVEFLLELKHERKLYDSSLSREPRRCSHCCFSLIDGKCDSAIAKLFDWIPGHRGTGKCSGSLQSSDGRPPFAS